jgi:Ca2+-binding RTX toxin-like protein
MFQILSRLVGGASKSVPTTPARPSFRPQVEGLEDRRVMSANLVGSTLVINGSNGGDTVILSYKRIGFFNFVRVQETFDGFIQRDKHFLASRVSQISFTGRDGDDTLENNTAIRSWAYGGNGQDTFYGGSKNDWFHGGNDKDVLEGRGGNDTLYGSFGFDILDGGAGNDFLHGGIDGYADELTGGTGADTFQAEAYRSAGSPIFRFPIWFNRYSNRDQPQDFNAPQGDKVIGMPQLPVLVRI